jgi:hypothetical protein
MLLLAFLLQQAAETSLETPLHMSLMLLLSVHKLQVCSLLVLALWVLLVLLLLVLVLVPVLVLLLLLLLLLLRLLLLLVLLMLEHLQTLLMYTPPAKLHRLIIFVLMPLLLMHLLLVCLGMWLLILLLLALLILLLLGQAWELQRNRLLGSRSSLFSPNAGSGCGTALPSSS